MLSWGNIVPLICAYEHCLLASQTEHSQSTQLSSSSPVKMAAPSVPIQMLQAACQLWLCVPATIKHSGRVTYGRDTSEYWDVRILGRNGTLIRLTETFLSHVPNRARPQWIGIRSTCAATM